MNIKHQIFYRLLLPPVRLVLWLKFGYRGKRAKALPKNYIVLSNHTTDWDPLFVGASFSRQMYFVGSEHIARWPVAYKFLKFAFAPIMRYKGASAASAVADVLKKLRSGNNVCIFAEGVRSWDGRPSPIAPSTAKLVKRSGAGLVTYNIIGGYFLSPMWALNMRRGHMRGEPVRVYTPEELSLMTEEQIYQAILRDLGENAYARREKELHCYRGRELAAGLDTLLFTCDKCHAHGKMSTAGDVLKCSACGAEFTYDETGLLSGEPIYSFADRQRERIEQDAASGLEYTAKGTLSTVKRHIEHSVCAGDVSIGAGGLRCGNMCFELQDISEMAMHGRRALVFTHKNDYYELVVPDGENALKLLLMYREAKKER